MKPSVAIVIGVILVGALCGIVGLSIGYEFGQRRPHLTSYQDENVRVTSQYDYSKKCVGVTISRTNPWSFQWFKLE